MLRCFHNITVVNSPVDMNDRCNDAVVMSYSPLNETEIELGLCFFQK